VIIAFALRISREAEVYFFKLIAVALLTLACVLTCALAPARAQNRVALVIGNDRYANLPEHEQLQKAVNDAHAVGGALMQIGFEVMSGENAGRQALVDRLDAFAQRLTKGDTAFFFFSGHGVALGGVNYILPSDIPNIEENQEVRLKEAALAEQAIVSHLQGRGVRVAVVVLDACRTNPFIRSGSRGVGLDKGLVMPLQVNGVFSIYAARAGQAARDRLSDTDINPNSVFSRVLVPALTRPGVDLTALAFDVREEVARAAAGAGYTQEPAYYDGTIGGRVYLAGPPPVGVPATAGVSPAPPPGETAWSFLKDTTDAAMLRRFIEEYPLSPHRHQAEERLMALVRTHVAATLPLRPADAVSAGGSCIATAASLAAGRAAAPLSAAEECSLQPKDSFRECEDCPEMVVVPAGKFTMGSPADERGRYDDEGPQHIVTIRKPFAVGRLHVTVDQFAAFVLATGSKSTNWRNPGIALEGSHPVVRVTWDESKAYVDWLATRTGQPYRLPSESEWEYAARGKTSPGTYPRFWFGDNEKDLCRYGNGNTKSLCNDGYDSGTSPAGHYQPNAFGLYDMLGAAWQWTMDCWHKDYNGAPADGSFWVTECQDGGRAVRGGAWSSSPGNLRAAARDRLTDSMNTVGFRVARTLTTP
jgi:formylglycine-generating enzyme required for sulfatase activity